MDNIFKAYLKEQRDKIDIISILLEAQRADLAEIIWRDVHDWVVTAQFNLEKGELEFRND